MRTYFEMQNPCRIGDQPVEARQSTKPTPQLIPKVWVRRGFGCAAVRGEIWYKKPGRSQAVLRFYWVTNHFRHWSPDILL